MNEVARIHDQLHRAFYGDAWHGPSLNEILQGVGARKALAKPLKKGHNIWEIVLHIAAWEDCARRRIEGEKLNLTPEQDWPKIKSPGDKAWKETLGYLKSTHDNLGRTAQGIAEERLSENLTGGSYSVYFQLHGIIQHTLYHTGQIAILKKR